MYNITTILSNANKKFHFLLNLREITHLPKCNNCYNCQNMKILYHD